MIRLEFLGKGGTIKVKKWKRKIEIEIEIKRERRKKPPYANTCG